MTKQPFRFTLFLLVCFSISVTTTAQIVDIPDPNLRSAIEAELGKTSGDTITVADMKTLTELFARNANITNLTGLEYATNLTGLALWNNAISDLSPVAGLTNLTGLRLRNNSISDISAVAGLTNLTWLGLGDNSISDISPVVGLTNLTVLGLWGNSISDISAVAGLTNLTWLGLWGNSISDISAVAGLTNLTELGLSNNSISDISPLVANTGLGGGDRVYVRGNFLNSPSINTHIPALQSIGVEVDFDNIVVQPEDIAQTVDIPDPNLRSAIEAELGKTSGDTITVADMKTLTELFARNANITNLTGLEYATNLTGLALWNNAISDLSPVAGLTNLTGLRLRNNSISDISAVAGLTNLTWLGLGDNAISDISPVAGLTNLTWLGLGDNSISDISPVVGLTNLTVLGLWGNSISDISAVAGLTNLTWLGLWGNSISDISAVAGLTNLTELGLSNNSISDISPLVANTGLGGGDRVYVRGNFLNSPSINTHIPALQSRGVEVDFDNIVVQTVDIPDPNLRAAVEAELGKTSGDTITVADMKTLTKLFAPNANITDLTGLEFATNLAPLHLGSEYVEAERAYINSNSISDLSLLAGLTNLTGLWLEGNSISDISAVAGLTNLTRLWLRVNSISDISAVAGLTNLTELGLSNNSISDISPVAGLTNLTWLRLEGNSISDISAVAGLTNLTRLVLGGNSISDISAVAGLTNLTELGLGDNAISDISPVAGLTNLTWLRLGGNSISDISPVAGLTNLTWLFLSNNSISDISPVAGLTNLTKLFLRVNSISDISAVAGLTNLTWLFLRVNSISDISPVAGLTNLTWLMLRVNSISDISPLVANTGLGAGDRVSVESNPLSCLSIDTHIPALQLRGVVVSFDNLKCPAPEYLLSIPAGTSLIHVPLKVAKVDGAAQTIKSIADLYDALGGATAVNFLITYDSEAQEWRSYFGTSDRGTPTDSTLTDDIGIIAGMIAPTSVRLSGDVLGTDGSSTITLNQGLNLVGLPLKDPRINRVSDLLRLNGIGGNVPMIILTDDGEFKPVGRAGDPGDIAITGGQVFILTAQREASVTIFGGGWDNTAAIAAAPSLSLKGIEVGDVTPVLVLRGSIVDEGTGLNKPNFRVTVKNLSTGRAVATATADDETGYRLTVVDIEAGRAATVGDTLEILAQSPNPFIGVEPLRYTVTAEDVKQSWIQLPALVACEIPAETQLLANYPNPFNPETWIPYRLAEDALVKLTIYDGSGQIVRTLDVGHQTAAVYESRSKAVYWDGRNGLGEQVASGVYFYHLSAGDFSAIRKMLILK